MDQFTYGNYQSAINLVDILSKHNKKIQHKAGAMLNIYRHWMNSLKYSHNSCYIAISVLIVKEAEEKINASPHLPENVKSHMISIIKTDRKVLLRNEMTIRKNLIINYRHQGLSYHDAKKHAHLEILKMYSHD